MKAIQTIDHAEINDKWAWYRLAYRVHESTQNSDVKLVCALVACSFQGAQWCRENNHKYIRFDAIDKQIIQEEAVRLKLI